LAGGHNGFGVYGFVAGIAVAARFAKNEQHAQAGYEKRSRNAVLHIKMGCWVKHHKIQKNPERIKVG
jgi:hypothetical protein